MQNRAAARVQSAYAEEFGQAPTGLVWSPYRLSPLGVHTDHQGGMTMGFSLDRGVHLVWRRGPGGAGRLRSLNEPAAPVILDASGGVEGPAWGRYVRALEGALQPRGMSLRGIDVVLEGELPSGGIASSAALLIALAKCARAASGVALPNADLIDCVLSAERDGLGVPVGPLDPTVIIEGRPDALVVIDCADRQVALHRLPARMPDVGWMLIDSGVRRELASTAYAERVAECAAAAIELGATGTNPRLGQIAPEDHRRRRRELAPVLARRAEHFFSEHKRVKQLLRVLSAADRAGFGRLMSASAESLVTFFEVGTPETIALLRILQRTPKVLGVNFCGGGFGGHLLVLADPADLPAIGREALSGYRAAHPVAAEQSVVEIVGMGPGASEVAL